MLVPFVVDADSLDPDPSWSGATLRSCHENLLNFWSRFGLLMHDGPDPEHSQLNLAISRLPPKLKQRWKDALLHSPRVAFPRPWQGAVTQDTVNELCPDVALGLIDDTRAEVEFGFSNDEDEKTVDTPQGVKLVLSRLQACTHSRVARDSEALSADGISGTSGYREIWETRFRSLASVASADFKQVSIVDRFSVGRHIKPQDRHQLSGLERFLRLLNADAGGPRRVSVFSAWSPELRDVHAERVQQEIEELIEHLPCRNIDQVTVFMVPNAEYSGVTADRYVRLGRYVWELGHGLEVFEMGSTRQWSTATFKGKERAHQCIEDELRRRAQPRLIKVKG